MNSHHSRDRAFAPSDADQDPVAVSRFGEDTGSGNLLGVQPYMTPADYACYERFHQRLDGYLVSARRAGLVGEKTIVVLPEYLGVWLVVAGEQESVYSARTVSAATRRLVAGNLAPFLRWIPFVGAPQRARRAVFHMKAEAMAAAYHAAFSRLAREHSVTVVAGSIILPAPSARDGRLVVGRGPLYNTSVVYSPDGRAMEPPVRKAFVVEQELGYLSTGALDDLPIFETPAGRLGVLVCADSWHAAAYERLREQRADIVAVPSFLSPDRRWLEPWRGYSGPRPHDLDLADERSLTEADAWAKYALPGRMALSGCRVGINVFFRGRLWDLAPEGQVLAVAGRKTYAGPDTEGAALVSLSLPPP